MTDGINRTIAWLGYFTDAAWRGRNVYAGTVPAHVKAERRRRNKVARRQRRINRQRG